MSRVPPACARALRRLRDQRSACQPVSPWPWQRTSHCWQGRTTNCDVNGTYLLLLSSLVSIQLPSVSPQSWGEKAKREKFFSRFPFCPFPFPHLPIYPFALSSNPQSAFRNRQSDHSLLLQLRQPLLCHPQLTAVNFFIVHAHMGRAGPANPAWRTRKLGDDILHLHRTQLWILHGRNSLARLEVRIGADAGDVVHRNASALAFIEPFQDLFGRAFSDPAAHNGVNLIDVSDTGA